MSHYMYWYANVTPDEVDKLKELGFCFMDNDDEVILYNEQYEYELVRMYTSDGHGIVDVDTDNFYFEQSDSGALTINAVKPMTTPVKSYKIRMSDKHPGAQWFYFSPDQEDVLLADDTWMYLFEPDGTPAQDIVYRGMELEALNPIQSDEWGYARFDGVEFGFRQHQGVGQLRVKFTEVVDSDGDEWPYGKRIRVLVTEPAAPSIPMGGVLTSTSDSVIRVPVEQAGGVIEVYVPPVVPLSCWFMQDKSDIGVQQYFTYVFDTDGNYIIADTSKTYTVICGYKANGDSVGNSFSIGYNSGNGNKLWARSDGGYVTVSRLDYLES